MWQENTPIKRRIGNKMLFDNYVQVLEKIHLSQESRAEKD